MVLPLLVAASMIVACSTVAGVVAVMLVAPFNTAGSAAARLAAVSVRSWDETPGPVGSAVVLVPTVSAEAMI